MSNYAVISSTTNICDNVVVWDDKLGPWTPPDGNYIIKIDGLGVGIGYYYNPASGVWTAPPTVTATFNPTPVFIGQNTVLSWSCENATSVSLSNVPGETFPATGEQSMTFSSTGTNTVKITATGLAGSVSYSATIKVYAAGETIPNG